MPGTLPRPRLPPQLPSLSFLPARLEPGGPKGSVLSSAGRVLLWGTPPLGAVAENRTSSRSFSPACESGTLPPPPWEEVGSCGPFYPTGCRCLWTKRKKRKSRRVPQGENSSELGMNGAESRGVRQRWTSCQRASPAQTGGRWEGAQETRQTTCVFPAEEQVREAEAKGASNPVVIKEIRIKFSELKDTLGVEFKRFRETS